MKIYITYEKLLNFCTSPYLKDILKRFDYKQVTFSVTDDIVISFRIVSYSYL